MLVTTLDDIDERIDGNENDCDSKMKVTILMMRESDSDNNDSVDDINYYHNGYGGDHGDDDSGR